MKRIAVILSILLVGLTSASAKVVRLSNCGNCPDDAVNIRQAIVVATHNGTEPGTVILTGNFSLLGWIVVGVPNLTVKAGSSGAILDGSLLPRATIELVAGADGFMLSGVAVFGYRGVGFWADTPVPVNNVTIENNTIVSPWRGVLQWASNPSSRGWIIRNNRFYCAPDCSQWVVGLLLNGSEGTINNNAFNYESTGSGIVIQNALDLPDAGSGWLVEGNTIDTADAMGIISGSSNHVVRNVSTMPGSTGLSVNPGFTVDENGVPNWYGRSPLMNEITNNQFTNKSIYAIGVSAGCNGTSLITNTVGISGTTGTGIDLGDDQYNGYAIGYPVARNNQIHANQTAGGGIGILLRTKTADNVATGNKMLKGNPPLQGILDQGTNNTVQGNH
jgi:hypothetical protein